MVTEFIDAERLSRFVEESSLTLKQMLKMTCQFLRLVGQIHERDVFHRLIQPENILISTSFNFNFDDQIDFFFIDFQMALIKANVDQRHAEGHQIATLTEQEFSLVDRFYRVPQFDLNSSSNQQPMSTIDPSLVCALLFWMITGSTPHRLRDISHSAPHRREQDERRIREKVHEETGRVEEEISSSLLFTNFRRTDWTKCFIAKTTPADLRTWLWGSW